MSLWRQVTRGLRVLTNRAAADREVADEVQHYLDQATDAWVARGLPPEEARRAARRELGNTTVVREQVRAYGWENAVGTAIGDFRYAARRLRGSPGFTAVSMVTLALGIGASTAIFSAVNPILFEPLPYPQPGRIVMISDVGVSRAALDVTFGTYREVAERSRAFETLAVMRPWQPTVTGAAQPERLDGQRVSADYFRVLGVHPAVGRDFAASDDRLNGPRVVIISDAVWHRRFSADDRIVGREIRLNDNAYSVIGVMPQAFENVLSPSAEVWTPLQYDPALSDFQGREWGHHLRMAGRLQAGAGIDRAARELDVIARSPVPEFSRPPWSALTQGLIVRSLQEELTRGVKSALLAVLGAVMLVLVIACVNVTNLLLARGAQRRGEFAMRAALGAGRSRLVRQVLTESLLLAVLGGALGMVVAQGGIQALVALSPAGLPRVGEIGFDGRVFAFSLVTTTLIGLMVGLIPALQASRTNLHGGVQESSRRTAGGHQLARRTLVVLEVALALVLLVGSGLLLRSLQRLFAIAPGFQPANVLTMQVQTSGHRFDDDKVQHQFFEQALDAVRQVPGVAEAGFTSQLPLSGDWAVYGVKFESSATQTPESDEDRGAFRYAVSPGYVEALGIPVRSGRSLTVRDAAGAPPVALLNESFAKRRFPGHDAIGQRLHIGDDSGPLFTVVGIVGDVKQMSLALDQTDAVYFPGVQARSMDTALSLVVRARGDAAALTPAIKQAIWSVDKDQPIVRVATMNALLAASAAERRFALLLFEAFALVALVLAGAGIYGVLAGSVAERTREIGVRAALGASRAKILGLILRQGMTLTGLGIAIGLAGAVLASQSIVALLFGVSRLDPATYLGVTAVLLGVSAVASWIPAWRASRVDPAMTLRAD
jgi:putative ABC transport system permease protein